MNKFKKNESGFGAVEVIIVLAVVGLLGVIGWITYTNNGQAPMNTNSSNNAHTAAKLLTIEKKNIPKGWTIYGDDTSVMASKSTPVGCSVSIQKVSDKTAKAADSTTLISKLTNSNPTIITRLPESTMVINTNNGLSTIKSYPFTKYYQGESVLDSEDGFIVRNGNYIHISEGCNNSIDDKSAIAVQARSEQTKVIQSVKIDLSIQ